MSSNINSFRNIKEIDCLSDEEIDNQELSNEFQLRYDIQSIINSSDELRKSEAIAEGFSLLLQKISTLEKIRLSLITKYSLIKEENCKLYKENTALSRDSGYYQDKYNNSELELRELKSYIERNKEKIIKYDQTLLEINSLERTNLKLKEEYNNIKENNNRIKTLEIKNSKEMTEFKDNIELLKIEVNRLSHDINMKDEEIYRLKSKLHAEINKSSSNIQVNRTYSNNVINKNEETINNDEIENESNNMTDINQLYNIEDISLKIKETEERIRVLNEEFDLLDIPLQMSMRDSKNLTVSKQFNSKFTKAKEIMDILERESAQLLDLKCIFNQLYKSFSN